MSIHSRAGSTSRAPRSAGSTSCAPWGTWCEFIDTIWRRARGPPLARRDGTRPPLAARAVRDECRPGRDPEGRPDAIQQLRRVPVGGHQSARRHRLVRGSSRPARGLLQVQPDVRPALPAVRAASVRARAARLEPAERLAAVLRPGAPLAWSPGGYRPGARVSGTAAVAAVHAEQRPGRSVDDFGVSRVRARPAARGGAVDRVGDVHQALPAGGSDARAVSSPALALRRATSRPCRRARRAAAGGGFARRAGGPIPLLATHRGGGYAEPRQLADAVLVHVVRSRLAQLAGAARGHRAAAAPARAGAPALGG